jgi:hypothetical protein
MLFTPTRLTLLLLGIVGVMMILRFMLEAEDSEYSAIGIFFSIIAVLAFLTLVVLHLTGKVKDADKAFFG